MSDTIPDGWRVEPLGEIIKQLIDFRGRTPKKLGMEWGGGNIRALSANNVQMGLVDFNKECYLASNELYAKWMTKGDTRKGDILFTMEAPLGNVALVPDDKKYILSQRVILIKVAPSKIESHFLFQQLRSDQFQRQLSENSTGSTAVGIPQKRLVQLDVVIPPLPEQQKIAAILSSVDDVIEKTRAQIDKLKDLKTGMMQELLTKGIGHTEFKDSPVGRIPVSWNVTTIGDLGKVITGSTPKTNDPANYNGDIPFISPSDIGEAMYIETTKSSITEKGIREIRELPKGSVCVVCIGSTIGKTGITTKRCATNQQVNSVVCKGTHPEFVYYLLTYYSKVIKAEAGTQAVPLINKSSFNALLVQLPPYSEQIKIGNSIYSVDHREAGLRKKLNEVQSLKKALMQDLLTGKVRVNLTDKESAAV